jgi:hypothetical protein
MPRALTLLVTLLGGLLLGVAMSMATAGSNGPPAQLKAARGSSAPLAANTPTIAEQVSAGSVTLSTVKTAELADALASMDLPNDEQARIADDVEVGKYKLLWLTVWDWDGDVIADRITIASGNYRRTLELPKSRKTIAVPSPSSTFIEITGDPRNVGYAGWTTLGLLSGARPIALSRMVPGTTARIDIDLAD